MSSPETYTYHSAAEMATRHLVSQQQQQQSTSPTSSDSPDSPTDVRPGMPERRKTNNYEEALAATTSPSDSAKSGAKEAGDANRPGLAGRRQQSYEIRDMRGAAMQSYLAEDKAHAGST